VATIRTILKRTQVGIVGAGPAELLLGHQVYGQQEVVKDLIQERMAARADILFASLAENYVGLPLSQRLQLME
jgi:hypothetical protein